MKKQDPQLTMLIELILPKEIFKYFDVINIVDHSSQVDIYLDEKNNPPEEYVHDKLTSKGFSPEITIQDFPLRNKSLYLHIRRRKWINETSGKIITRNWDSVAKGTRMTNEFASFLKGLLGFIPDQQ